MQDEPRGHFLELVREAGTVRSPGDHARMHFLAVRTVDAVRAVAEEHLVPFEVQTAPQSWTGTVSVVVERPLVTAAAAPVTEGLCRMNVYDETVAVYGHFVDGGMLDFEQIFEYLFE